MRKILLLLIVLLLSCSAFATTRYVSSSLGSDSNTSTQAQSKSTPWAHLPGMASCTSACASYTPVAGDSFILYGGDSWTNANFPITWSWSGSSGSVIYVGVDQTWHSGASWVRPVWDAQATVISGSYNMFLYAQSISYLTVDNIEMKGITWSGAQTYAHLGYADFYGATYITWSNNYVHGWSHTGGSTSTTSSCTGTCDDLHIILGGTGGSTNLGSLITTSVFDGSDSTGGGDSGAVVYGWPSVTYSVMHDMSNGLLIHGHGEIGNNLIYNINQSFDASEHENCLEPIDADGTFYIHDNVVHDCTAESIFLGGGATGNIVYVWNNLFYNQSNSNPIHLDDRYNTWTGYFYNNTVVPKAGFPCFLQVGSTSTDSMTLTNNHCISTSASLDNITSPMTATRTTNLLQTPTAATTQGYTSSETFVYSPTTGGSTIGAGTNLTSSWPAGYSTSDTTYACTQGTGNVARCPARTVNTLPGSGAWDIGAYEYASGGPTTYTLTVTESGTGSGTVTSSDSVISCGSTCSESGITSGTSITMSQSATGGSIFAGWGGTCGCSGTGSCAPPITESCSVTAAFNLSGPSCLTISGKYSVTGQATLSCQ